MDIFSQLGDTLRGGLHGAPDSAPGVDKLTVLSSIEELVSVYQTLLTFYQNPNMRSILNVDDKSPTNSPSLQGLRKIYAVYRASLSGPAQRMEDRGAFTAVVYTAACILGDLRDIMANFDLLFGKDSAAQLQLSDFRVSTAATIGYLENSQSFMRWCVYTMNMATSAAAHDNPPVPPYQFTKALALSPLVARMCTMLSSVGPNDSFLGSMKQLKASGKDVALSVNGTPIDQYASDTNYDKRTLSHVGGFLPNIAMMFGKYSIERDRAQLDELKHIQNWLRNKISLLQLDMNRADPNSPEYRRAKALSDNYMKDLTTTDKKLAGYNG